MRRFRSAPLVIVVNKRWQLSAVCHLGASKSDGSIVPHTATIHLFKPTPWTRTAHLQPSVVAALAIIPSNRNPDGLVFGYASRGSVSKVWNNVCKRAAVKRLTAHCCRHGFATSMLHAGYDPKTVAERGGWKDATTVLRTYAHAMKDPTVTDVLFDAELTHPSAGKLLSTSNKREKS